MESKSKYFEKEVEFVGPSEMIQFDLQIESLPRGEDYSLVASKTYDLQKLGITL